MTCANVALTHRLALCQCGEPPLVGAVDGSLGEPGADFDLIVPGEEWAVSRSLVLLGTGWE